MNRRDRLTLVIVLLATTVGCDRATKWLAQNELAGSPPISVLREAIQLSYTLNAGAILSFGSQLPAGARFLLFVVFVSLTLVILLAFTLTARRIPRAQLIGLSLLAGGGLGNLIDRVIHQGQVVDFVRLKAGVFHTGVFNLADVAIFLGVAIFLLSSLTTRNDKHQPAM